MPYTAAIATIAPAVCRGMPIFSSTGVSSTPVDNTDEVQDPVIIPGNMMTMVITVSMVAGERPNLSIRSQVSASSRPFFSMTFMKTMAVISTRHTSR